MTARARPSPPPSWPATKPTSSAAASAAWPGPTSAWSWSTPPPPTRPTSSPPRLGARVVGRPCRGLPAPAQRRTGPGARCDWVLFVDADERVRRRWPLRSAIGCWRPGPNVGFWIPRRNVIAGVWVRHRRLVARPPATAAEAASARYDESGVVHEVAALDGPSDNLTEPLLHLNYETLAEFRREAAPVRHLWRPHAGESGRLVASTQSRAPADPRVSPPGVRAWRASARAARACASASRWRWPRSTPTASFCACPARPSAVSGRSAGCS